MITEGMRFLKFTMDGTLHDSLTTLRIIVTCLYIVATSTVLHILGTSVLISMKFGGSYRDNWDILVIASVRLFLEEMVYT